MITEQDVRAAIGRVRENFDPNALPVDAEFGDAGMDSLDHASILLELHESSGIEFPEEISGLNTIARIVRFAEEKKA
jgi:acyl carrier protein